MAKTVENAFDFRISWNPNSYFSKSFSLTSSRKISISSFCFVEDYDYDVLSDVCSVGDLLLGKCRKIFMELIYLDIEIHNSLSLPASLLLQRSQSIVCTRRRLLVISIILDQRNQSRVMSAQTSTPENSGPFFPFSPLIKSFRSLDPPFRWTFVICSEASEQDSISPQTNFRLRSENSPLVLFAEDTWIWAKFGHCDNSCFAIGCLSAHIGLHIDWFLLVQNK